MIAAFVHELQFLEDSNGNLYLRGYNKEYWERYLRYFDKLYVVGRKKRATLAQVKGLDIFSDPKLEIYEVPSIHSPKDAIINQTASVKLMEELVKKVDCIITRQPGRYSDRVINACKKENKPYLVEMVGCPWDSLWNHSLYGKIIAPSTTLRTKRNLRQAPFVIYVTEKFLQHRYPTNGQSTNCSNVTLPKLDKDILERRIKHIKNKSFEKIKIGTVAAVNVKYKGQQFVIQALSSLKEKGITSYEYHLVGGGDQSFLRDIAKQLDVENLVIFHGSLKHDEVFTFLDDIDLYVQPSLQEGLPRALIEAMSRGLPCFGAHTGGIPELLDSEFVFSNGKQRIKEIQKIISSFSKEVMLDQARKNFHEAEKYDAEEIDRRRRDMFECFLKSSV